MQRILAAFVAACCVVGGIGGVPETASAQEWNDVRTQALVERATERRAQQLADTGLVDYRATARGYLTFLAQLGEGFTEPPKIVKADQLMLEVYWKAPDQSKQRIVGRRDTLLLPTDISYHRDHLGIVQNNFPSIIRLGDGDEVRDVPHPLSREGLAAYDFSIRDSLAIRLPDRTVAVYEVRVRPKDDQEPRVVGAVYLDRRTGEVVRMAFNFTRAAYIDEQLEDLSVVLENALVENRWWLPSRQEIEIRRTGSWLDYPARGIIRGRWEITDYELNQGIPSGYFRGPEIVTAPIAEQRAFEWEGRILDSLPPDVRAVTDADVRAVQEEARALVRRDALARARTTNLAARRVSDFIRVNRVEGLALGAGLTRRLGHGLSASLGARYGFADHDAKGRLAFSWRRASGAGVELLAYREYRDVGDLPETSLIRNSLAAQEFGSDYTDPYDTRGIEAAIALGRAAGVRWTLLAGVERQDALAVEAEPFEGTYEPTIPAWSLRETRVALRAERPTALSFFGTEVSAEAELRGALFDPRDIVLDEDHPRYLRASALLRIERPIGAHRLVLQTTAAGVGATPEPPPQALVYAGGLVTGPGYDFHRFVGRFAATQRVEWRLLVPFVAIPLGRFGTAPAAATLAPYLHAVAVAPPRGATGADEGVYPSVGVGLLTLFDLLRFDVARGLRNGRWTFSVDVVREFWEVL